MCACERVCVYVCMYVCVCVCAIDEGRREAGGARKEGRSGGAQEKQEPYLKCGKLQQKLILYPMLKKARAI